MSFAMVADLLIANESAFFLQAFRNIGLVPDGGATYMLPRKIGMARAMEMVMLGERVSAAKGLEWGLVNRVVPDEMLLAEARAIATNLAAGPTKALGMIRHMMWQSTTNSMTEQLALETSNQVEAMASRDASEGRRAFLEKRKPVFTGE